MAEAEKNITEFENDYKEAIKNGTNVNTKTYKIKRLAEFLVHVLTAGNYTPEHIEAAKKIIIRFTILANQKVTDENGEEIALFDTPMFKWKEGGVIEHKTEFDLEKFRK